MIAARDLSLSLHGTPILRGLSFEVAPGEVFGLIGESGSGKSMTALALMGLAPRGAVVSGQVHLGETELTRLPDRRLRALRGNRIGMIFQEPMTALNPVQTIGDQVAETLVIHGRAGRAEALRQARDRLDRVGLQKIPLDRYPHQLSGGQRQRVCIAMAVALRPELLIADEPATALDVTTQARILDLLRGLVAEDGMGLMLITHDLGVVAGMADRLAVMQDGRIVEQGTAGDVIAAPAHAYTRALFRAAGHQPEPVQATPGAPVLEAERLERLYPAPPLSSSPPTHALRGVSLRLHQGESLGLVGESGCGKSTLARALLGLDPVQGGRLSLFGQDATAGLPNRLRAGIQVVFQDPYGSFNPRWRVERLVAEPFHLMPGRPADWRARVGRALGDVGLSPKDRHRFIHEFSGGQRQRIAIARALITEPRIVVLDEAVSALDVQVRAQILDLLADLRARLGLSYLFISHDLNVVRRITDRVMVMRAGEIVETGPTGQVFAAPSHPYTKELVAATPALPTQWRSGGPGERPVA